MNMNELLRKLAVILERKQDALFSYDIDKQREYIAKLGNPKDEIERSYFQYKCQAKFNGKGITLLLNILSFPMTIYYWLKNGRKTLVNKLEHKNLIFFRDGKPNNILPNSLLKRYKKIEFDPIDGFHLTKKDRKFIQKIYFRYPFSWLFILKCLIKVGKYSFAIETYAPEAIAVCSEYSFTSSVLTTYCKQRKIKHINVMHGEKMYYMRDSFFKFDECFIWDEYYGKILSSMKAEKNQFIVEVPDSLRLNGELSKSKIYDYTYYLGAESADALMRISIVLKKLSMKGNKISIRPHPRYSNIEEVERLFPFINIEDTRSVSIEQSLLRTGAAISLYSTVLNQALYNSIPIVIDNMCNTNNYKKLHELGYVCLFKKHKLLSDIVEDKV